MPLDDHIILVCKSDQTVECVPIVMSGRGIELSPLQLILGRKTFKLSSQDLRKESIIEIVWINGSRSDGDVLPGSLVSERSCSS